MNRTYLAYINVCTSPMNGDDVHTKCILRRDIKVRHFSNNIFMETTLVYLNKFSPHKLEYHKMKYQKTRNI